MFNPKHRLMEASIIPKSQRHNHFIFEPLHGANFERKSDRYLDWVTDQTILRSKLELDWVCQPADIDAFNFGCHENRMNDRSSQTTTQASPFRCLISDMTGKVVITMMNWKMDLFANQQSFEGFRGRETAAEIVFSTSNLGRLRYLSIHNLFFPTLLACSVVSPFRSSRHLHSKGKAKVNAITKG